MNDMFKQMLLNLEIVNASNRINNSQREALTRCKIIVHELEERLTTIANELDQRPNDNEGWIKFDYEDHNTRPTKDGTYLVQLSSGKHVFNEWKDRKWQRGPIGRVAFYKKVKPAK